MSVQSLPAQVQPVVLWGPRRRARRWPVPVLAAAIAALLGTDLYLLTQARVTTPVSAEQAVARFRERAAAEPAPPSPVPADAVVEPAPVARPGGAGPAGGGARTVEVPVVPARKAPAQPGGGSGPTFGMPAEGVYSYRTSGGDSISVAGARHTYPERTYAAVRHLGGCRWEERNEVVEEHVDQRVLCNDAGRTFQLEQRRDVEFFGRRDGMAFRCDPPQLQAALDEAAGAVTTSRCYDDEGSEAHLTRTNLGRASLVVGGVMVEAIHVKLDGVMTGRARGTSRDELWISATDGLTLRWDRTVDTLANAAFGAEVRYQEQASFVLESLTPRT